MNIIYDTQSTINENINLRLNGLRPRSETSEGLKNLNGKWIQICMRGFRPFLGSPGLRAGPGAADFLHVRHPIPQSRFASVGGCKPRSRPCGLLANQGRAAVSRSIGPAGVGGSPAVVRVVGESGWGGGVPVCRKPGARVCRIKRVSVCPAVGRQSDADTGVGRPESGGADECRVRLRPDARPAGICVGQSTEPRRRFAGKGCLLRVRALCRACPQK